MLFDNPDLLSNEELREKLMQDGYSFELANSIIQQFWIHDWGNSFIADKKNFAALQKFLSKDKSKKFSRFDFYTFFYSTTVPNYEKIYKPLQKIAIVFELMQTDRVSPARFEEILRELKIGEISLQFLQDTKLITIVEEEKQQIAKWTHHTLTEYLSAFYVLEQKDILKTIEKLMCNSESGSTTFISSWGGTLRFLIEKVPETITDWIDKNLKTNPDFLNDHIAEVIVFDAPSNISEKYKTKLFHLIYDTYQEKKLWIPVWAYHNLYKFIDEKVYQSLKENANNKDFEYKGNTAAIIDGMLRKDHHLLKKPEKNFWKEKLISYAQEKNENEVLNRHAMSALENFKGQTDIIPQVKNNFESDDSLVRDAFISMCSAIDANFQDSIEVFIKAISEGISPIYARHALYSIDTPEGIEIFLKKISDNPKFIHAFLDDESIFNKTDTQADIALIENIKKNKNETVIKILKNLIISAYIGEKNYDAGKSWFLQQIALIIQAEEPNYLDEFVQAIVSLEPEKQKQLFINDIECVLSVLLKPEKLESLKEIFQDKLHHHAGYALAQAVRLAPYAGNLDGKAVLQKGIKLGITADPKEVKQYKDYQAEQNEKICQQFREYLNPGEKKYFPQVFRYFIENKKLLTSKATNEEKERLLELAVESNLQKINPTDIQMRYTTPGSKSGQYTISSVSSYFPAVLEVIQELKPEVLKIPENRKKIIEFIPFSYLSDFRNLREIVGEITDDELQTVNKIMLDKTNDVRYLIPQTYIYLAKTLDGLKSPKSVLLSFIEDPDIQEHDRIYALETIKKYLSASDTEVETLLKKLWDQKSRDQISELSNALLISVFHDTNAINWRFEALRSSATPFHRQEGAHSVGKAEMELDSLVFAKPLIELKNEKYMKQFIQLLNFSLKLNEDDEYKEYVNYLWRIAIAFVVRDNFFLSETSYESLKQWADQNKKIPNINWFKKRLDSTFEQYLNNKSKLTNLKKVLEMIV